MRRIREMVKRGTKYLSVAVRFDELREDSLLTECDEYSSNFQCNVLETFLIGCADEFSTVREFRLKSNRCHAARRIALHV